MPGDRQFHARLFSYLPRNGLEYGLFGFYAEAGQGANASVAGRACELLRRLYIEFLVQGAHAFRPEAADFHQLRERVRHLPVQYIEQPALAGRYDFFYPGSEVGTDAWQFGEVVTARQHFRYGDGQALQGACGIAVGAYAKRILVADLQQVGDLVEHGGNVGVMYGHGRSFPDRELLFAAVRDRYRAAARVCVQ